MRSLILSVALLAGLPLTAAAQDSKAATARPMPSARLLLCEPAANAPGMALALVQVDFPPSALSQPHRHAGVVGAVVVSGVVRSQLHGGKVVDYKAGEAFFEPVGAVHAMAENPSASEPASLIAAFITDVGCKGLTTVEQR